MQDRESGHILSQLHASGLATIELNRPHKKNAFTGAMVSQISDLLTAWSENKNIRLLLIKSAGTGGAVFSAGADLKEMKASASESPESNQSKALQLAGMFRLIFSFPTPVLTLINGPAFGGAVGIIAASDIVLSVPDAHFCCSETRLGLIPAVISPYLTYAIGLRNARRYLVTGEIFSAHQAEKMGLVSEVCTAVEERARVIIDEVLKCAPGATRECKAMLADVNKLTISSSWPDVSADLKMAERLALTRVGDECQKGLSAFFEKKPPVWITKNNESDGHE